ncbi:hypothetical protein [Streptomyces tropicalis]|uniref:Secreted protein n=1 Tax=Streptomyces tropicalis TaxID=3034234 RepID=A0ABT5ZYC1_9ACTN|nr:hypothetical protein [Streptomyces tropicalis]MDF3297368.1 hypothetical protein [Streptomyces tropicalis]
MCTAAVATLPLLLHALTAGTASAAPADPAPPPLPLPYSGVRSVHPGDTLAVAARTGRLADGEAVDSAAFLAPGRLRMMAPVLTAAVTVACDVRPGTYPVRLTASRGDAERPPGQGGFWARVRVEPAGAAARRACRKKVERLPPPEREERWAPGTGWPQTEWDVRTFRAGSRVAVTDDFDEGLDGEVALTSEAFTGRVVLRGARAVLTATAVIRCGAAPGLYPVYRHGPGGAADPDPWARLRVAAAPPGAVCPPPQADGRGSALAAADLAGWTAGGALLAGTLTILLTRRTRSRRRTEVPGTPPPADG